MQNKGKGIRLKGRVQRMADKIKFSSEEIAGFCEQISMLLDGGISLYDGVDMLAQEMEDKETKDVLEKLDQALRENKTFYDALTETEAFPEYMLKMVQIGETTGKLDTVMQALSVYYKRESIMQHNIKNVIAYPMMMFTMMAVILTILVWKILPMFQGVMKELDVEAAASSTHMMNVGTTLGKVVAVVGISVFVLVCGFAIWYRTKTGKNKINHFFQNFVLTRKLANVMATGKFVSAMALMTSTGFDGLEALNMAEEVVDNKKLKQKVKAGADLMGENKTLEEAVKETELLTGMESRMLSVAAKTGVMDQVFEKLTSKYDDKIEEDLGSLCTKVETSLVITLSLVVGAVLISVMLPLVSIISSIG